MQKCRIRAAYTVQSTAVPILTIFVFLSCRWFVELNCVMLSFNAGKTTAKDLQLQLNRRLCRPPCFPNEKLGWFYVRLVGLYTSFFYKKLGSSVRGLRLIWMDHAVVIWVERRTSDREVAGLTPAAALLRKLFTATWLCHRAVDQQAVMLFGCEGNCRPGGE